MDKKPRFPRSFIALIVGFFACCWMFFLGVLVGRGTAPVSFDTRKFQASLAGLAAVSKEQEKKFEKPELEFYEVLKNPVRTGGVTAEETGEILPAGVGNMASRENEFKKQPPIKRSLKGMTARPKSKTGQEEAVSDPVANVFAEKEVTKTLPVDGEGNEFTIQVAAYRNITDAMEEIGRLKSKGIPSYRTMGRVGEDIWHRVRTGSFKDMASAQKELDRLRRDGIKAMILNKKE